MSLNHGPLVLTIEAQPQNLKLRSIGWLLNTKNLNLSTSSMVNIILLEENFMVNIMIFNEMVYAYFFSQVWLLFLVSENCVRMRVNGLSLTLYRPMVEEEMQTEEGISVLFSEPTLLML